MAACGWPGGGTAVDDSAKVRRHFGANPGRSNPMPEPTTTDRYQKVEGWVWCIDHNRVEAAADACPAIQNLYVRKRVAR
jgi:hypothetical protein